MKWRVVAAVLVFVFLAWFELSAGLAQVRSQRRVTSVRPGSANEGSRVTVVSDSALNDYEAYRRGDRFYVKIPAADLAAAQSRFTGSGYDDAQVQKVGDGVVLSFRLQPGTAARVDQRFNRLDVVFSTAGRPNPATSAASNPASSSPSGIGRSQNPSGTANRNAGSYVDPRAGYSAQGTTATQRPNVAPGTNSPSERSGNTSGQVNQGSDQSNAGGTTAAIDSSGSSTSGSSPSLISPAPNQSTSSSQQPGTTGPRDSRTAPAANLTLVQRASQNWLTVLIAAVLLSALAILLIRYKPFGSRRKRPRHSKERLAKPKSMGESAPSDAPALMNFSSPAGSPVPSVPVSAKADVDTGIGGADELPVPSAPVSSKDDIDRARFSGTAESSMPADPVLAVTDVDKPQTSGPGSPETSRVGRKLETPTQPNISPSIEPQPLVEGQPVSGPQISAQQVDVEVRELLAGREYDASVISSTDSTTRQMIAAQLLAAIGARTFEHRDYVRQEFLKHGYFDEITRDLRTADSPSERVAAAIKLGQVDSQLATSHLVAALHDTAPEVRSAAVQSLAQLGDPVAIPPLKELLSRESSRQVPKSTIREAIEKIAAVTTKSPDSSPRVGESHNRVFQTYERESVQEVVEPRQVLVVPSEEAAKPLASSSSHPVASVVEKPEETLSTEETRLLKEEQALLRAAEELERKGLEAQRAREKAEEEARRRAEEKARKRAEEEARKRAEEEARKRAEEEARRRADEEARKRAEEEARRRVEEEARRRAEEEARKRAEEEARRRAEEEARRRVEEEARRRAEEEARKRAEEEALRRVEEETRKRAEEEAARRQVEEEFRMPFVMEVGGRTENEAQTRAEEEARFLLEAQVLRKAAEELARKRAKAAAARRFVEQQERVEKEEELRRQLEEEERRRAELEARRQLDEEEAQGRAEEQRQRESAERRLAAEQQLRQEQEALMQAAAEIARRRGEVEAERKRAEKESLLLAHAREQIRAEQEKRRLELEDKQQHVSIQDAEEQQIVAQKARERAEQEQRIRAEIVALRQAEVEQRRRIEAETQRRAEAEARLKDEEARRQAEEAARVKAEQEALRLGEEARLQAEKEAALRAAAETRLREEENRRQAEVEARVRAETEAHRLAKEANRRAEEEAALRAAAEARLKQEEIRRRSEEEGRLAAEAEARRLSEEAHRRAEESGQQAIPIEHAYVEYVEQTSADLPWVEVPLHQPERVEEVGRADEPPTPHMLQPSVKAIDTVAAEKGIAQLSDDSSVPADVLQKLKSSLSTERSAALTQLARMPGDDSFRLISEAFDDQAPEVRHAAAHALYELQPDRAASFTKALREGTPERRRNIGSALAASGLANDAIANLTGESREKTYDAFSLLFLMAKAGEVQPLMQAIEDHPNVEVRLAVVKLLALSGQGEIVPAFRRLAVRGSLPSEVRSAVMEAIYQISSQARESTPSAA